MISVKYFLNKIKDVKPKDILSFFPMIGAGILSPLYKNKYKNVWLICEEKQEARDNGYWFFRKMCENHPEQKCIYAIDKKSVDYEKVKDLGKVISYGSFKHWIIYFTCKYNISSQKGGKPNAAVCAFIELNNWYNAHNIFLQHGVIINKLIWLYADRSRFDMFITSAAPEKQYIENTFGYNKDIIKLTGLARFDNLHNNKVKQNRIIIMPTWRSWFNLKSKQTSIEDEVFANSEYFFKWKELIECKQLNNMIDKYNLEVIFYPHRNMQNHVNEFKSGNSKVIIASWKDYDLQELLKSSEMMITDYSSVFFDMVYMKKPVLFYQFDLQRFRSGHYDEGYFDYSDNPFGKSCLDIDTLFSELTNIIENHYKCSGDFLKAHNEYFPLYDDKNSERIFDEINKLENY